MATSTNTSRDTDREAAYQPGGQYETWNDNTGGLKRGLNNGDSYDGSFNEDRISDKASNQQSAVDSLRSVENSALSKKEPSYYTGSGRNNNAGSQKAKGKKKKFGALLTILLLIGGGGAFLGASNSLLAPALSALTTASTQTSFTSYTLRNRYIMRGMMDDAGGAVTTTWTGAKKYSKIPNYMKNRLASQGIEVTGSGKNTRLTWTHTTPSGGTEVISDIDAQSFLNMYNDNVEFRESYTRAKRGRVATFFDNVANKIYKKLGISRNLFSSYKQTGDNDVNTTAYKDTLSKKFEGDTTDFSTKSHRQEEVEVKHEDGSVTTEIDYIAEDTDGSAKTGKNNVDMEANTHSMIAGVAESVGRIGSTICTAMKVGSMIGIAAAAQETYQAVNYFMSQMENISKMQYGNGDESAINNLLNFLSTSSTTNVSDFNGMNFSFLSSQSDGKSLDTATETGAPLESSGLLRMLSNAPATASSTNNYSLERVLKSLGGALSMTAATATTCAGVDIATSLVSVAVTIGTGGLAKVFSSVITKISFNVVTVVAVTSMLSFLVPTLAQVFFGNTAELIGIPAGHMLAKGAAAANMREARSGSGQAVSDSGAVYAFNKQTNTVLALEAEQDRLTHSPFDITNRNTFFGGIAYSLLPTLTSTKTTGLASFLRSTTKSLSSLISPVYAEGEGSSYLTTYGDCPILDDIGAVGDLYCNPIVTTDMSTIEMSPDNSKLQDVLMEGVDNGPNLTCEDDGNCEIVEDSNLAYYVAFCDNRDSPFGAVDQNILGAMQPGWSSNPIVNAIPIVGDIADAVNAGLDLQNISWANGEKCGNTQQNSEFWQSEGKYYQRYIEDQRILEQMGAYEGSQNPVVAFEEKLEQEYLENNPEANTYIGYLSRISGLTIENTKTVLAYVIYYDFVDQYDPTLRIAMTGDTSVIKDGEQVALEIINNTTHFDNNDIIDNPIETNTATREYIAYFDVRNRSYTV